MLLVTFSIMKTSDRFTRKIADNEYIHDGQLPNQISADLLNSDRKH